MTEASSSEVYPDLRQADQIPSANSVREKSHHQILQEPLRVFQSHISPLRRITRLLQEYGVARDLRDVNRNTQTLTCEDGVHNGYILVR